MHDTIKQHFSCTTNRKGSWDRFNLCEVNQIWITNINIDQLSLGCLKWKTFPNWRKFCWLEMKGNQTSSMTGYVSLGDQSIMWSLISYFWIPSVTGYVSVGYIWRQVQVLQSLIFNLCTSCMTGYILVRQVSLL